MSLLERLTARLRHRRYIGGAPEQVFENIYRDRAWHSKESASGRGSDLDQTLALRDQLPVVLRELEVRKLLDVPCGDFNWIRQIVEADSHLEYFGGDIVRNLIDSNSKRYTSERIHFSVVDLATTELPSADLLFCRDCLVHLSFDLIYQVLANIRRSCLNYVALTTFVNIQNNHDILNGEWRPLNMELAPFSFPPPLKLIDEDSTEKSGRIAGKSIGIWRAIDIA